MNALVAIDLVLALLERAAAISAKISLARAENRNLTQAEWASIQEDDDRARDALVAAIQKAKDEGR